MKNWVFFDLSEYSSLLWNRSKSRIVDQHREIKKKETNWQSVFMV